MLENNKPLISIIVIAYNSSKYVLETLESAKAQSYPNIELIITDDCSTDDTLQVCKDWLAENKGSFFRTELITVVKNTGIPANCNRGVHVSNGDWIKLIAGDDILDHNCIQNYVNFVQEQPHVKVLYAKFLSFDTNLNNALTPSYYGYKNFFSPKITAKEQFKKLLRRNFSHGPTFFISKSLLLSLGGFDERYKFEDLSLALKMTSKNIKLYFLNKITVYYRTNNPSITNPSKTNVLFSSFYKSKYQFDVEQVFPHANFMIVLCKKYEYYSLLWMEKSGLNKKNLLSRVIYKVCYLINPLNIYNTYF